MSYQEYQPRTLVLMLSGQCNIICDHCIVNGSPYNHDRLSNETITDTTTQAKENRIDHSILYGGEPFLRMNDTLPYAMEASFKQGLDVTVATNGFWGRTEKFATDTMAKLERIAQTYDRMLSIYLSIDAHHAAFIPTESIAHIIKVFRLGSFPHLSLGLGTFDSDEDDKAYEKIFDLLRASNIHLLESNDSTFVYPALPEDLIEGTPENYPLIKKKLGLQENETDERMWRVIKTRLEFGEHPLIAREFDSGFGDKRYLMFGNKHFTIDLMVDSIISAGRAQKNKKFEIKTEYASNDNPYIIYAPDGNAYGYPAQIAQQLFPVSYENKSLQQVIYEVDNATNKLELSLLK